MSFFMVVFWRIVGARNLKARLCVFRMDLNEFGKISDLIYDRCGSLEWNECCRYFVLFFFFCLMEKFLFRFSLQI